MKVGYVRCSTAEQNEARQLKMMEEQKAEIWNNENAENNANYKEKCINTFGWRI